MARWRRVISPPSSSPRSSQRGGPTDWPRYVRLHHHWWWYAPPPQLVSTGPFGGWPLMMQNKQTVDKQVSWRLSASVLSYTASDSAGFALSLVRLPVLFCYRILLHLSYQTSGSKPRRRGGTVLIALSLLPLWHWLKCKHADIKRLPAALFGPRNSSWEYISDLFGSFYIHFIQKGRLRFIRLET